MAFTLLEILVIYGLSIEVYLILLVIAIPTFFFWKWLFRKFFKVDRTRKIATWTATLIATPAIYIGLILLMLFGMAYTPNKDFNKSKWLTDKEGRFQMASNIIESKMLIGKDSNQIKEILGDPTSGSYSTWQSNPINSWTYDMGMAGGFGLLLHYLVIEFKSNRVISVTHAKIRD